MSDASKGIAIGPCCVFYGGVYLGYTIGGVKLTLTTETKRIDIDSFGTIVRKQFITGRTIAVTCPFAESTVARIASLITDGTLGAGELANSTTLKVNSNVGYDIAANSKTLTLVDPAFLNDAGFNVDAFDLPNGFGDTIWQSDVKGLVQVLAAFVTSDMTINFDPGSPRLVNVQFTGIDTPDGLVSFTNL